MAVPQFAQNLPVLGVPHSVQNHWPAGAAGAGLAAPQFEQNLPVLDGPHEQVHVPDPEGAKPPSAAALPTWGCCPAAARTIVTSAETWPT